MVFIYSLQLQNNKFYIGKTDNPNFRLENHFNDSGSAWTKKHNPISIHQVIPECTDHDEQRITQEYMKKYGIDNVRGGPWCRIKLDPDEIQFIKKLIQSETDECYQCGSKNHFVKDWPEKKNICKRCGRFGHKDKNCFAKVDTKDKEIFSEGIWECDFCEKEFDSLKGCQFHENVHCTKRRGMKKKSFDLAHALFDELKDSSDEEYYEKNSYTCFRCGRKGHMANNCFANKHIKGYNLSY